MSTGEIIKLIISILSLLGVGTLFSMFWKDRHDKKQSQTEEAKKNAKKVKQAEMREVVEDVVNKRMDELNERLDTLQERLAKVEALLKTDCEGTQAGLRNDLLQVYYDCAKKGFRTRYDSENFRDMYIAYTKLDGNSFIQHDVKTWFEEIPSKETFERKHKGE